MHSITRIHADDVEALSELVKELVTKYAVHAVLYNSPDERDEDGNAQVEFFGDRADEAAKELE